MDATGTTTPSRGCSNRGSSSTASMLHSTTLSLAGCRSWVPALCGSAHYAALRTWKLGEQTFLSQVKRRIIELAAHLVTVRHVERAW